MEKKYWRKCAVCKKEIELGAIYQKCNVTSCKKHVFCSVECWDTHQSIMGHKSAWAEENRAPKVLSVEDLRERSLQESEPSVAVGSVSSDGASRRILIDPNKARLTESGICTQVRSTSHQIANANNIDDELATDILIVASKLKKYVKDRYNLNTSANVFDKLSDYVRKITDQACEHAINDGRKTVMDRDFLS